MFLTASKNLQSYPYSLVMSILIFDDYSLIFDNDVIIETFFCDLIYQKWTIRPIVATIDAVLSLLATEHVFTVKFSRCNHYKFLDNN